MKNFISWLVFVLLILFGIYFLFKARAEAHEYSIPPEQEFLFEKYIARTKYVDNRNNSRESKQKAEWRAEFDFHMFHAKRTYEDAKERSWWIPDLTMRERARHCFIAAFSMIGSSTPTGRLVMAISSLFMQYGLDCMDEWDYIQDKLSWSQYHFDQCDHYAQLLHG